MTPLTYESVPSENDWSATTLETLVPANVSELGGEFTPKPHKNEFVPMPELTIPGAPVELMKTPEEAPAIGTSTALASTSSATDCPKTSKLATLIPAKATAGIQSPFSRRRRQSTNEELLAALRFPEQRDNGPVLRRSTIPILSTSIIFPFPLLPVFRPGDTRFAGRRSEAGIVPRDKLFLKEY
jgi:hypothetical protein